METHTPAACAKQPLRADARRNHGRILAAASAAIAEHGAAASLEEIARQAGVGSATLHRHFPTRSALLDAVFRDVADLLCAMADDLLTDPSPGSGLMTWLGAVVEHGVRQRGLAASLLAGAYGGVSHGGSGYLAIRAAGQRLLDRAQLAGVVRKDLAIPALLTLVNAICLATELAPDRAEQADHLLTLVIDGVCCPHPASRRPGLRPTTTRVSAQRQ